jgi:hypothetical protein
LEETRKECKILVGNILEDSLLRETERIREDNIKINVDYED